MILLLFLNYTILKFKTWPLFPLIASLSSLLTFVPVCLSSVSDPCPYPSCLYLPLYTSLPLSDIVYPFFRLSLIFPARGCRCIVSTVFAFPHSVEIQDLTPMSLCSPFTHH